MARLEDITAGANVTGILGGIPVSVVAVKWHGTNGMMDIKGISEMVAPIAQKYGADRVALFGSRAKNTARETSDYDFVISRGNISSLFQLAAFIEELEKAFGGHVDVITDTSNDIGFLAQIKKEEIVVYETSR